MLKSVQLQISERLDALGEFPRKAVECLVTFTLLMLVYSYYIKSRLEQAGGTIYLDITLLPVLLKFIAFAGGPVALVTWLDPNWRDQDTAGVCFAAYLAANYFMVRLTGCPGCVFALVYMLVPHFFSALVGHKIGARLRPSRGDE